MSTLSVSNITDGTDTVETGYVVNGSAKAWVKVLQNPATLYDTFNVSTYTDLGVGRGQPNFSSSMEDTGYASVGSGYGGVNTSLALVEFESTSPTGGIPFYHATSTSTTMTISDGQVSVFVMGDLA